MAIPKQHELYEPIFRLFADNRERTLNDVEAAMCQHFKLTDSESQTLKGSGTQRLMMNRCGWATWRLSQPSLIVRVERGTYQMSEAGFLRSQSPKPLARLELFPKNGYISDTAANNDDDVDDPVTPNNPEESIEESYKTLRTKLSEDLLAEIKQRSPEFFENLVVKLMLAIGYGGSRQEAGKAVGRSGDGGIDGIISEDRLGLDAIYLQAKRWEGSVGSPEIMKFIGALARQRATKGVFITTSTFTKDALESVASINYKVVLIDGERLADLMIEYNLGVSTAVTYELKKVDTDFFSEE